MRVLLLLAALLAGCAEERVLSLAAPTCVIFCFVSVTYVHADRDSAGPR